MKTLTLSLKKKWFDMIASGEKKEEYREINQYWKNRLCTFSSDEDGSFYEIKHFETVEFTLGYPRKDDMSRRMKFKIEDICFDKGNPDWGAENGAVYFVIKLGERLC